MNPNELYIFITTIGVVKCTVDFFRSWSFDSNIEMVFSAI